MISQIVTDRLVMRPLVAADGDRVVEMLNNYSVSQWLARVPFPFSHSDLRILDENGGSRWPGLMGISLDGTLIGGLSCGTDFGYYLTPAFWGRGLATEAGRAVLETYFQQTQANQIGAGYFPNNAPSKRVLDKLGFKYLRRGRQHCTAQGADLDHVEVELTRADWEAQQ
ncbi:GNAT family N-acetyltransferase [Algirhabdus cladophorae]|uniref:GNAT family N-acetyltransferase n=1 Tax=Algirhabdus cladophorae TaxID=3377108 RepID=UPI003B84A378